MLTRIGKYFARLKSEPSFAVKFFVAVQSYVFPNINVDAGLNLAEWHNCFIMTLVCSNWKTLVAMFRHRGVFSNSSVQLI